ncbi:CPBP family glutamic-type intramembrane protease [Streptomyces sp. NBC_00439]|uniref:CPBP family glutamic-type intramembrane protease n=1 Tax=unclassified Streptomyces TaxID=2593676 RepID=UPI00224D6FAF|nr:CPBP family glutamic-type intramembrane protease [Streptomyces sp. NBC_00439]MCX5103621.1 CPBP family glutamic-type intramembrane protease [Streptomyces sp. NBC_00439]WSX06229.1 CPBP family glutamic-type intramembrane protease [Streptomyces sp. NBC_00987]
MPTSRALNGYTARNADLIYLSVLGLFITVSAPHTWGAVTRFLYLHGADIDVYAAAETASSLSWAANGLAVFWTLILWNRNSSSTKVLVRCIGLIPVTFLAFADGTGVLSRIAQLALLVTLTATVCAHHRVTPEMLGPQSPKCGSSARSALATVACAFALLCFSNPLSALITTLGAPVPPTDPTTPSALGGLPQFVAQIVWSATVEEFVVTVAVVALLASAKRPLWECLLVSALMRTIPHLYLGLPALAMLVAGAAMALLYYQHRQVLPLVVAHIAYDLLTLLPVQYANMTMQLTVGVLVVSALLLCVPAALGSPGMGAGEIPRPAQAAECLALPPKMDTPSSAGDGAPR